MIYGTSYNWWEITASTTTAINTIPVGQWLIEQR